MMTMMMMNDSTGVYWYWSVEILHCSTTIYASFLDHVPPFKITQSWNRHGLIGHALMTSY